jgi:hypothetical protein
MSKRIYSAIALIAVGAFLLLSNFNLIHFNWRMVLYLLGILWGLDHITRYHHTGRSGQLFWGIAILGNSLWLASLNLFWPYLSYIEMLAGISFIFALALTAMLLLEKQFFALISALPLYAFSFLILNEEYMWYPQFSMNHWGKAALGMVLLSAGIYYMTRKQCAEKES